jgi:putative ABC transport system permease protein
MLRNYFITAWRNLLRNKVYSLLNVMGLATGMAVALVIGLWVYYQYSFDRFLPGYEKVYTAKLRYTENGEIGVGGATPMPLAAALKKDIPGVEYVAQSDWMGPHGLVVGEKKLYISGGMVGEDFLKIFQYELLKGTAGNVLTDPYSIVLSQSTANSLFGNEVAMGKMVRIDNSHDLKVTGILADLPENATHNFRFLVPFEFYKLSNEFVKRTESNWRDNSYQTFVSLKENVDYSQVEPALNKIIKNYDPENSRIYKTNVILQPMKNWHLFSEFKNGVVSGGFIEYVKMFSIIGVLVLLIACINFMNLSTARSEKRAREVGVRKAIGSRRKDLILQFLVESVVISLIAFIISLLLVQFSLPAFNTLTRSTISIPFTNIVFWFIMLSYVLLTGLLAGSRPALYLSAFQPVKVLKGSVQMGRAATLPRKILVVLQFSCSVALIISTIIVYQQIWHAKEQPKGYDSNRLIMTDASNDLNKNYDAFKNELLQSGIVSTVTKSSNPVTEIWSNNDVSNWQGKLPGENLGLATIGVSDADYFSTLGIEFTAGINFTGNLGSDSLTVILNEAAVKRMRYKEAIGQIITWHDIPQNVKVIGVVKNALMASPYAPAQPTIFIFAPGWASTITYKLSATVKTQDALTKLAPIFNQFNPSFPYLYRFVDESYAYKFNFETLIGKLAGIFAVLAIFISCLGLFGLAAYMAEQRNKEIGIRKVLGASVSQVWVLLSKEFILLVSISCVIASTLAFYFLQGWLQRYDYRISIGPGVFIISAMLALLITVITISFQAIKAAIANPVKSLKTD